MPIFDRVSAELPVQLKYTDYDLVDLDAGTEIQFLTSSPLTANLPHVALVSNGYNVILRNIGSGTLVVEPADEQQIDGESSLAVEPNAWRWIRNDGTSWKTVSTNPGGSGPFMFGTSVFQAFRLEFQNTSGTVQHQFTSSTGDNILNFASGINSPATTFTNTPNGTDSSTAFAGGLKISSADNAYLIFDTADLIDEAAMKWLAFVNVQFSNVSASHAMGSRMIVSSQNVNGVTRDRLGLIWIDTSGNLVPFNTTTISLAKTVRFDIWGFLPTYS